MTIQLARPDFQQLTRIVQNLPDFANVCDLRWLVAGALEGAFKAAVTVSRLDQDGYLLPPLGR